jgi:di/tricarboxylate transporter
MTQPVATVLVLLLIALVLFATEKIPIDIVTILLVIGLVLTGTLNVSEAFAGFGNDIVITIAGLFVLTGGLVKTGVVDLVGRRLHRIAGGNEFKLTTLIMFTAAACASVMKNTTTTAMFVPVVLGIAQRARVQPSKLLMPLAFGAILGGTCTLIGTSTNLAVSGALAKLGQNEELLQRFQISSQPLAPFTMFELTPVGIAIVVVGMLYMLLLGLRLLPARGAADSLVEQYGMRQYISEVVVVEGSPLAGKTLAEGNLSEMLDLTVIGIIRGTQGRLPPRGEEVLREGDLLLVQGRMEDILRVKDEAGIEIRSDFELQAHDLEAGDVELFEVMVLRGSEINGRTLRSLNFRDRYDMTVLAINRHGMALLTKLSTVTLRFGDVLLVQGTKEGVERLTADGHVLLLEEGDSQAQRERAGKRWWAVAAFVTFLFFSVLHLPQVPLAIAVLFGVLILLASRAVLLREVYELIDWRLIVLIAGMISFGTAMEKSKADQYLADLNVNNFQAYGGLAVLAGFFALTVALTQPMSNQAAALVVLPIAVKTALALGLNPRAFAVAVTYAASCSFLTPLEPACVLIYTPGRYRFLDFVKVGSILTIAVFAIVMLLVPYFWPLR